MTNGRRLKGALAVLVSAVLASGCAHQYSRWAPLVSKADEEVIKRIVSKAPQSHRRLLQEHSIPRAGGQNEQKAREDYAREWVEEDLGPGTLYRTLRVAGVPTSHVDTGGESDPVVRETAEENACKLRVMFGQEHEAIREARPNSAPYIGLALSGGGIRSAGFAAGVLKGLHELGLLDKIGYMSTISGGGYTGGWYMYHGYESANDSDPDPVSNHTTDTTGELFRPGSAHLQHIVQSGSFLSGGNSRRSAAELLRHTLVHLANVPSVWVFNWLFDSQVNWTSHYREVYRAGVANAFLYEHPSGESELTLYLDHLVRQLERSGPFFVAINAPIGWLMTYVKPVRGLYHFQLNLGFPVDLVRVSASRRTVERTVREVTPSPVVPRPYWVAGAQVTLLDDDQIATKGRSGDYFEFTPIRCGADSVGYVVTPEGQGRDGFWMMPDHALAISGAALDADGLEIGFWAGLLSRSFGVDLGYFVSSWGRGWVEGDSWFRMKLCQATYWITAIGPVRWLCQVFGNTDHDLHRNAKNYLLTDGGHFDNTGLYGLVRRGCRLIIVADATAEAPVNDWNRLGLREQAKLFEDFRNTEVKLQTDFGVEFEMDWEDFSPQSRDGDGRPNGLLINGRIRNLPVYCDFPTPGGKTRRKFSHYVQILYLRSAYDVNEAVRKSQSFIDRQQGLTPDFPNLSTFDLNYTEPEMAGMVQLGYDAVTTKKAEFISAFERVEKLESSAASK